MRRRFRLRGNEFPCRSTGGTAAGTARTGAGRCGGATGRLFASDTFAPFLLHLPVVQTPVGKVLLIGATMTVERERELFGKKVKTDERAGTHN